jgi:hypothetical protein
MPAISRFFEITIYMYDKDHSPPHFHAKYNDEEIIVSIEDCKVANGSMKPRVTALILERAMLYKEQLMEDWNIALQN